MPKPNGRPRLEFNLDQVLAAASMQCTEAEIASLLGCSQDTVTRRKQEDPAFADALQRGREEGKVSLRRLQWRQAKAGHVTMLIWLGKQYLGQVDKAEVGGLRGGPVELAMRRADELTTEEAVKILGLSRRRGGLKVTEEPEP
jgi:hypothetical protein